MIPYRFASALAFVTVGFAVVVSAQTDKPFPSDDEIKLVLTQTERAMEQYKPLIDREAVEMGKNGFDAAARDRKVVEGLEMAVKAFKTKPQGFNGPLGFTFFEWLDDASRNAVACGSGAISQSVSYITEGNTDRASSLVALAQSCSEVSTLIYTVGESAGALYQRYVEAEQQLAVKATEVAEKCTDILKKNKSK